MKKRLIILCLILMTVIIFAVQIRTTGNEKHLFVDADQPADNETTFKTINAALAKAYSTMAEPDNIYDVVINVAPGSYNETIASSGPETTFAFDKTLYITGDKDDMPILDGQDTSLYAFFFLRSKNVVIENFIVRNYQWSGFRINYCTDIIIRNNIVYNCGYNHTQAYEGLGIRLAYGASITMEKNILYNNGPGYAMLNNPEEYPLGHGSAVIGLIDSTVDSNTAFDNYGNGIHMEKNYYMNYRDNALSNNIGYNKSTFRFNDIIVCGGTWRDGGAYVTYDNNIFKKNIIGYKYSNYAGDTAGDILRNNIIKDNIYDLDITTFNARTIDEIRSDIVSIENTNVYSDEHAKFTFVNESPANRPNTNEQVTIHAISAQLESVLFGSIPSFNDTRNYSYWYKYSDSDNNIGYRYTTRIYVNNNNADFIEFNLYKITDATINVHFVKDHNVYKSKAGMVSHTLSNTGDNYELTYNLGINPFKAVYKSYNPDKYDVPFELTTDTSITFLISKALTVLPEISPTPTPMQYIANGDFTAGLTGWSISVPPVIAALEHDALNQEAKIIVASSMTEWDDITWCTDVTGLTQGRRYTLSFTARTDQNEQGIKVGVGTVNGDGYAAYRKKTLTITNDFKRYELDFMVNENMSGNNRVQFEFGKDTGTVHIDEVTLTIADAFHIPPVKSLIANGEFAYPIDQWTLDVAGDAEAGVVPAMMTVDTDTIKTAKISILDGGTNTPTTDLPTDSVLFSQSGLKVEKGKTYRVQLVMFHDDTITPDMSRKVKIAVGSNDPLAQRYYEDTVQVTKLQSIAAHTYTGEFLMTGTTDGDAMFTIHCGGANSTGTELNNDPIDLFVTHVEVSEIPGDTAPLTYYVSTAGTADDFSNDGLTEMTAFSTIQHAVDMALLKSEELDRDVMVKVLSRENAGTFSSYTQTVTISDKHPENRIIISGDATHDQNKVAVLDGGGMHEYGFRMNNSSNIVIEKLYIQNYTNAGIMMENSNTIDISRCVLSMNGIDGIALNESSANIMDNLLYLNSTTTDAGVSGAAINATSITNSNILRNVVNKNNRAAIIVNNGKRVVIDGNSTNDNTIGGIYTCGKAVTVSHNKEYDFNPTPTPVPVGDNLALGKPVSVSSVYPTPGYDAARAVDGDLSTLWSSDTTSSSQSQWIFVDLEQESLITGVGIAWGEYNGTIYYSRDFEILGSDNATTWETIRHIQNAPAKDVVLPLSDGASYRYIGLRMNDNPVSNIVALKEFEVYGVFPTPTPTPCPAWDVGVAYRVGDCVVYGGNHYACIQPHTSLVGWTPDVVASLWAKQ